MVNMGGRQPDAIRLIHSESDDERKPSLSPDPPGPAPKMVVAQSPPIFGPDRPFPPHILDLLKEYHRVNGNRPPQFAYKGRPTSPSKVFDRHGKEVDLSLFAIVEPSPYRVLILHRPGERDNLVTCHLPYVSKFGTYLVAWLGVEKGYETECCAVRIFNRDRGAIQFSDQAWKALNNLRKKSHHATPRAAETTPGNKRGLETPRSTKATGTNSAANGRSANPKANVNSSAANKTAAFNDNGKGNADADSESGYETDSGSDESSEEEASDEEEPAPLPPAKKVKTAPVSSAARSTPGSAVFKLVSYKSGAIRCFPLEECTTGKDLFKKARDFFRLFDRNVDVKILSCQISSRPEQHYLFEGSEGEFALLVEQVKGPHAGGRCTVEIGHVVSC